ncbi:MAG: sulfite exporter TauE/SafE family protein [Bacteroidetes bacterium]|nr:sulfite exporter TauE/SafE family protein [Bacteroidota bacterium]MBU2584775.1 sulfite exporter TauE/SafE family protein [Bacteroidota bacterium]
MEYIIICLAALLTSGLTLFSGFGLGTLLMPVFAIFFPIDIAVAMTAIVHFLNNLFKLYLLGKHANKSVVLRFGLPAIITALVGAQILVWLSGIDPLFQYEFLGKLLVVTPVKFIIAVLMIVFALFEIVPALEKFSVEKKYLPLGGLLSGFFGGLSGHQGALRSAFLVRCGLTKESFIATGVVIACLVDVSRLSIYASHFSSEGLSSNLNLLIAATLSAFLGAFIGNKLVKKVTMKAIQIIVSIMLSAIAVGLGSGMI